MSPTCARCCALLACVVVSACVQWPGRAPAPESAPPPPSAPAAPPPAPAAPVPAPPEPVSVLDLNATPAAQALLAGLRAYEEGKYALAERKLGEALKAGLAAPRDRAAAHKTLAFLYCTSQRPRQCDGAFRAARAADPRFALSKAEAGHPLWGPVYRRSVGSTEQ